MTPSGGSHREGPPRPGWAGRLLELLGAALLGAIGLLTCAQVLFRYVLEAPLAWSEELVRFLFVWLSFLGAAICFRRGGHFRLEFLARTLPAAGGRGVRIAVDLLVLGFAGLLTWQGTTNLRFAFLSRYVVLEVSAGWSYLAIPVAGAIMILYALDDLRRQLRAAP